jgi:hypothetical protein
LSRELLKNHLPFWQSILALNSSLINHHFRPPKVDNFKHQIWSYFWDPFLDIFTVGGRRGEIYRKLGVPKCPKSRFLLYSSVYDFRSERSAPRPPKKWHFWPPLWSKRTDYLWGMAFSIGPFLGVDFWGRKWGSFCRKLQKLKKIHKFAPRVPKTKKVDFLWFSTPPWHINFRALLEQIIICHFGIFFNKILAINFNVNII